MDGLDIMSNEIIEGFRLSPQQKRLWLLQKNGFVSKSQCAVLIEGKLNIKSLESAFWQVVNRHEALRTNFLRHVGIKIPIQAISASGNILWQFFNLDNIAPQEKTKKINEIIQSEKSFIFDFEQELYLRSSLVNLAENRYILLLNLPSIWADSWSLKNLVEELKNAYKTKTSFPDEPVQYIQFSEWQNELLEEENANSGKAYWQQQSLGKASLTLPFECKRSVEIKFVDDVYALQIDADLFNKLKAKATQYNTTIANFLLTCWQTLLWKITGQSEIIVNTVLSGRKYEELHEVLGLLAKWLPVRCSFQDNLRFTEVLSDIIETLSKHETWQEYFLGEENIKTVGDAAKLPINFEFEEIPDKYQADEVSFTIDKLDVCFEPSKVKLTCVQKQESIALEFCYIPELIGKEAIECLAEQFQTLLKNAVENPELTVSELEITSDRQLEELLVELNNTHSNYPKDKCIHHLFETQVEKTPHNIAVVFGQQLTYSQLNTRANQLAHYLQKLGVGTETLVGIYLERSHLSIIAILAILKAGAAYLPLDSALPAQGLDFRLQDAQVSILLTQQSLIKQLPETTVQIACLDTDWEVIAQENQANPQTLVKPENLVYVIFTSGSTGKPKAVAVEHQQLLNYLYGILDRLPLPAGGSFATVSSFAADLGNTVIFPALCNGGCLHVLSQEQASDPQALADYFRQHPIDCLKIVPSHLAALIASSQSQPILPRQCLILGGEASSWDLIEKIWAQAPKCQIFNHYGPTETTVGVLTYEVQERTISHNSHIVPLGKPLANTQAYILDRQLRPVPIGLPGELYIGGAPLSRGYLNRPELTSERFIQNPFIPEARLYKTGDLVRYLPDGNLEFIGRVDNQVKIRGFRIELGEIEATLRQHPTLQEVVVLATEEALGDRRLVAYVVANFKLQVTNQNLHSALISELRSVCLQKLPEYMLPSAFVFLKTLPLTPNGKIDRQALLALEHTRPELEQTYIAPRTPLEKQLAEIWTNLLALQQVGIHDNFFELGGHSLLITQLLAKVRNTWKVELPLREFFDAPTIADLAKSIDEGVNTKATSVANLLDLNAEAILDSAISPANSVYTQEQSQVNSIFLTGATGFLGVFLLNELLQQTPANIYCLVRAETAADAKQRLQNSLKSYLLWDESFSQRIIPIVGDLSQPLLGLSEHQFRSLASQIDVIYHNGAVVNFTYPYSALKAANVLGTQEVLRLATEIKLKYLHFISTIGVVAVSKLQVVEEVNSLESGEGITGGYTQSKWVAEKLVKIAGDRGVPVSIYRPGRISGHSITGVCNTDDHTFRMIRGCIELGSVPNDNAMVNLTPVDYASQAIVYLSQQKASLGKVFHIVNPQPMHWNKLVSSICSFGYQLRQISYQQWRAELLDSAERSHDNALYPLIAIFSNSEPDRANNESSAIYQIDCQNTLSALAGTAITCPPVDSKLLNTYFSYLICSGFLAKPQPNKMYY
jgi:amino acid adenylation domain-containing protein/thioester reductase-like protein